MPEPSTIERAELHELDADFSKTVNDDRTVKVQFNPETLKVTFANQIVQNTGAGDQRGPRRGSSSAPGRPSWPCSCGST